MKKLNPILSKPYCGWSSFCVGDFSFSVSYVTDAPQDILDALINNIKYNVSTVVGLDSEGTECTVVFCPYAGIYTIINKSDNDVLDNKIEARYFMINIKRVAKQFIKDIEDYKELWADWQTFTEEDPKKYYDLSELKTLVND